MSSRSLEMSMFSGLRVASTFFTPEYSVNGKNVSAKLTVNAFQNIASKANDGKGKNEALSFTIWGKLAHTCAKSMSPGKEFNCQAHVNVYKGKTYFPGVNNQAGIQVMCPDGTPLMSKKVSFTVSRLTFDGESKKHINNELQAGVRPALWDKEGTPDNLQWIEILKARQAIQFNPQSPTYGYANVRMPQGANIGPVVQTTAGVAATFTGVNPAAAIPAPTQPATAPIVAAGGFVTAPAGV